jgi:adenylate cyclase
VCGATWERAQRELEGREVDVIRVVGKQDPVRVFEVLGERGSVAAPVLDMRGHFEAGLAAYRNRGYGDAKAAFRRALDCVPGDACSQVFIQRLEFMEQTPLPPEWDGVWQHEHK